MLSATEANEIAKTSQLSQLETRIKTNAMLGKTTLATLSLSQEHQAILEKNGYTITKNPTDCGFIISWEN